MGTFAKMCAGFGTMPERTDRRDDALVVMPDLDQEYAKIAQEHGLPVRSKAKPDPREIGPTAMSEAHGKQSVENGRPHGAEVLLHHANSERPEDKESADVLEDTAEQGTEVEQAAA